MNTRVRVWGWLLLVAGGLTVVALPQGAITIGFFLAIAPGLVLVAAPNFLFYALLPYLACRAALASGGGGARATVAAGVTLAVVVGLTVIGVASLNRDVAHAVASLRAGDQEPDLPTAVHSLAIVAANQERGCGSLCQRLLYNNSVERVLLPAATPQQPLATLSNVKATAYWIERRPECPATPAIPNAFYQVIEQRGPGTSYTSVDIAAITKARVAAGDCLTSEDATLGDADLVVVEQRIKSGKSDYDVPFDLFLDTMTVQRLSVLGPDGPALAPRWQRTWAKWSPIAMPFFFGVAYDGGIGLRLALGRLTRVEGAFALDTFLEQQLKLKVRVPPGPAPEQAREMLVAALRDPAAGAGLALAKPYLTRLGQQKSIDATDFAVLRLLVADDRIREDLARLPSYRLGPEAEVLARPLAQRLLAADPGREREYIAGIADIIASMPPGTMASAATELDSVARDASRYPIAWKALARLADSGPASGPRLVQIFATVASRELPGQRDLAGAAIGAAQGLCQLGPAGTAARPYAQSIVRRAIANGTPDWNLSKVSILLLAHIGFAADVDDLFAQAGGVPRYVSMEIANSLRDPGDRACRFGFS
jgi:hypothetical protein